MQLSTLTLHRHRASGPGKYKYAKGGHFEGTWLNGLKTDKGVQVFPDGGKYEGASEHRDVLGQCRACGNPCF